jgi:hypothetical protein
MSSTRVTKVIYSRDGVDAGNVKQAGAIRNYGHDVDELMIATESIFVKVN